MRMMIVVATLFALAPPALAGEVPAKSFFSSNDVYQWCQHDKHMAQAYVGGMYDMAAHGAFVIDAMRQFGAMPKNDALVDFADAFVEFAIDRIVGFCKPEYTTLEQMTDVFCAYLKDTPAERDGLPSIMLNNALKKVWPCPGK
jgi:Rap1a immunity proteins